ncbi:hypothetical protein QOZ80_9AG0687370 [Eleusine coracana subsp. coracana]|nr:hypothetical protein QOZ80_9AG0687370 [Eleusine coracana subsp. coracana]
MAENCHHTAIDIDDVPKQRPRLPPPKYGEHITVLSIDGAGIRGLIPLQVLKKLEELLKEEEMKKNKEEGENARIADYFDVIAGTSTGGLIVAMLAVPDERSTDMRPRPKYTTEAIEEFYLKNGPGILSPPETKSTWGNLADTCIRPLMIGPKAGPMYDLLRQQVWWPKYENKKLIEAIDTGLNGGPGRPSSLTLGDTVTRVLIPAYDVKKRRVISFTTQTTKKHPDATLAAAYPCSCGTPTPRQSTISLRDVCLGATAAPTFFPAHHFTHGVEEDNNGQPRPREYNLVDGGVAQNNPTLLAIRSMFLEVEGCCECRPPKAINSDFHKDPTEPKPFDIAKCLVLSIGTGSQMKAYEVEQCKNWGLWAWFLDGDHHPLLDIFTSTSSSLINMDTGFLFRLNKCPEKYLRIDLSDLMRTCLHIVSTPSYTLMQPVQSVQENNTTVVNEDRTPDMALDAASEDNMKRLVQFGQDLLRDKVKRIITDSRIFIPTALPDGKRNEDELREFAKWLVHERNLRLGEEEKRRKQEEEHAETSAANSSASN